MVVVALTFLYIELVPKN